LSSVVGHHSASNSPHRINKDINVISGTLDLSIQIPDRNSPDNSEDLCDERRRIVAAQKLAKKWANK